METENNPTDTAQADVSQLNTPAGEKADISADSLTLAEINKLTGKDYKDKDSALKSIQDMSKQAGKASDLEGKLRAALEQPAENTPEVKPDDEVDTLRKEVSTLKTDNFFAQNPNHAENRELLEALAKANNVSLTEAVDLPAYKGVMDRLSAPAKRTVAASNSRVTSSSEENPIDKAISTRDPLEMAKAVTDTFIAK